MVNLKRCPNPHMLMQYAYEALINDIHERMKRVAEHERGDSELASRAFMRSTNNRTSWARRKAMARKDYELDRKRLDEAIALVEWMEEQVGGRDGEEGHYEA